MSAPHGTHDPDAVAVLPMDERLPVGKLAVVSIITLVSFAIGILWTVQIMNAVVEANETATGPRREATEIGRPEIGIVDQQLFAVERRADDFAQIKLQALQSAGWVSRKEQIVHIPIEQAMKAYVEGKRLPRTGSAVNPGITGDVTPEGTGEPQGGTEGAQTPATPGTGPQQSGQQSTGAATQGVPGKTQGTGSPRRGTQQRGSGQGGTDPNTNAPTR